jgi:hypothetical protein
MALVTIIMILSGTAVKVDNGNSNKNIIIVKATINMTVLPKTVVIASAKTVMKV